MKRSYKEEGTYIEVSFKTQGKILMQDLISRMERGLAIMRGKDELVS